MIIAPPNPSIDTHNFLRIQIHIAPLYCLYSFPVSTRKQKYTANDYLITHTVNVGNFRKACWPPIAFLVTWKRWYPVHQCKKLQLDHFSDNLYNRRSSWVFPNVGEGWCDTYLCRSFHLCEPFTYLRHADLGTGSRASHKEMTWLPCNCQ